MTIVDRKPIKHRESPVLNGHRVDVRHRKLVFGAIGDEMFKKLSLVGNVLFSIRNMTMRLYCTNL